MSGADVIDVARDAIWVLLIVAGPIMLIALGVGLIVALFQALTQIQEMTLTFVPKIVASQLTKSRKNVYYQFVKKFDLFWAKKSEKKSLLYRSSIPSGLSWRSLQT